MPKLIDELLDYFALSLVRGADFFHIGQTAHALVLAIIAFIHTGEIVFAGLMMAFLLIVCRLAYSATREAWEHTMHIFVQTTHPAATKSAVARKRATKATARRSGKAAKACTAESGKEKSKKTKRVR